MSTGGPVCQKCQIGQNLSLGIGGVAPLPAYPKGDGPVSLVGCWPRLMSARIAAIYVGEPSVDAFRRRVGTVWPLPVTGKGQRRKWDREDLDTVVGRMKGQPTQVFDAATVLGGAS
jgi:hypothetical protein